MLTDCHPTIIVGEVHDASEIGFGKLNPACNGIFRCHNIFYLSLSIEMKLMVRGCSPPTGLLIFHWNSFAVRPPFPFFPIFG